MISTRWIQQRKPGWDRLASLLERAGRRGFAALSSPELREISLLHQQAAADCAIAREDASAARLADYLNQLTARSHSLIYAGGGGTAGRILRFYRRTFPRIFRETAAYTLSAFIIFLAAGVAGFLVTLGDPAFQRFFLGAAMSDTIARHQMWTHSILTIKPLASSAIMTNNLTVSFTVFALGVTAGIGTVCLLAFNGMLMGVVSAACWQAGMLGKLASFVAPHGVLELPAIFMAGGAGLLIARGLLFPGLLPRRDALVVYGDRGVRLVVGIIPLLIIAGTIEAFISPSAFPVAAKLAVAAVAGSALVLYLGAS